MAVQIQRRQVVDVLRAAGLTQLADEVLRSLPEVVDLDRAADLLQRHGVTKDTLISRMGGNP
jgi:hypothetical protein